MIKSLGVIGCGNMAGAIVLGMYKKFPEIKFKTFTPSKTKAVELARQVSGEQVDSIAHLVDCEYIMLGMKPQQLPSFIEENAELLKGKKIISILTAITIEKLMQAFDTENVCRIMPNTPSAVGAGILLTSFSEKFEFPKEIENAFSACGIVEVVSQKDLDLLTVYAGSGPAYVFQFALYLQELMQDAGIDSSVARRIANQLFLGSSKLMSESNDSLSEMVNKVTSKGGVTIEAVKVFKEEDFAESFSRALSAASKRNVELAGELNSLK